MGITLKQLTDTVSLIKDYVLHKTYKIDQISYAQKTVNTELDYGVFEVTDMTINKTTPLIFSNVNSGNMELSENGYIKLQKDKTYVFHTGLYKADYNRGIALVDSELNVLTDFNTTSVGSYIYEAKEDIEVTFIVSDSGSISVSSLWGCVNVYEINRQIVIDPVEYVNQYDGIEDTPVGHIIPHMGTTSPKHYLICDGTEYGIMDYPYLAQHIADNFGSANFFGGDGLTTFAVPDLRERFLKGSDNAGINQEAGLPNITGTIGNIQTIGGKTATGLFEITYAGSAAYSGNTDGAYVVSIDASKCNSIYGNSNTVTPTNTSVLYCIKYEPTYFMNINRENTNYLSPTLYSEEERVVGCWIDGKPLYEKSIKINHYFTKVNEEITLDNIDTSECDLVMIDNTHTVVKLDSQSNAVYTVPFVHGSVLEASWGLFIRKGNPTILGWRAGSSVSLSDWHIETLTIQYTKTTDTENSFTTDMIKDYIVGGGNSSDGNQPSYGDGSSSGSPNAPSGGTVTCNCPTYTDEEVDAAIDEILADDIIEEEITTVEDTPMVIPEIYEEDEPTVIPEIIEEETPGEVTETPTEEEIIE